MTHPLDEDLQQRETLLDEWVATRQQIAQLEAHAAGLLARRVSLFERDAAEYGRHRDTIYRSLIAEYSAAGHVSKGTVEYAFSDSATLAAHLPTVQESFAAGSITAQHVREIVRAAGILLEAVHNGHVDAASVTVYEAAVLEIAENDTPARTRVHARQVAAKLAEATLRERHAHAAEERTVTLRSLDDGLALLTVVLPEHLAVAIYDRLTRMTTHIVRTRSEPGTSAGRAGADAPDAGAPGVDHDLPTGVTPLAAAALSDTETLDPADIDEVGATIPDTIPEWVLAGLDSGLDAALRTATELAEASTDDETLSDSDIDELVERDALIAETIPDWVLDSITAQTGIARDARTFDQIRTDLLIDLLLASDPTAVHGTGLDQIQAHIQVTVAAGTLAGLDDRLAELDGHGELHPDIARDLASRRGAWTRLFLDSAGMVTETDAYSPTDGMKRFLRARDQHCRFPGCRVPAMRCDIDHNHDHAKGGLTCIDNLTHLCRSHHTLKHPDLHDEDRWSAHLQPDGTVTWRSPLGRDYRDAPSRRVMFV